MARVLPSGLNATELTQSVWPVSGVPDLAAAGHVPQPHRAVAALPLARVLPSGLNATELTVPVWPVSGRADLAVAGHVPQPHRARRRLPVARVRPSGLNATEVTASVWPVSGDAVWRWLATSHSRTVSSAPPVARVLPSGLNATESTESVWPVRGEPTCGGWPRPTAAPLVVAAGGQGLAVRAERHRVDRVGVTGERGAGSGRWLATSHSRTVLSSLPLARVLPSGLNATERTADPIGGAPVRGSPIWRRLATSHSRTAL